MGLFVRMLECYPLSSSECPGQEGTDARDCHGHLPHEGSNSRIKSECRGCIQGFAEKLELGPQVKLSQSPPSLQTSSDVSVSSVVSYLKPRAS